MMTNSGSVTLILSKLQGPGRSERRILKIKLQGPGILERRILKIDVLE